MISIGYAKRYRKEELDKHGKLEWDKKPDMKDIVKFV